MILGDVEECITTVEIDEETCEEIFKVNINTNDKIRNTHLGKKLIICILMSVSE